MPLGSLKANQKLQPKGRGREEGTVVGLGAVASLGACPPTARVCRAREQQLQQRCRAGPRQHQGTPGCPRARAPSRAPQAPRGGRGRELYTVHGICPSWLLSSCDIPSHAAQPAVPAAFRSTVFYREFYLKHWLEVYNLELYTAEFPVPSVRFYRARDTTAL